MKKYPPSPKKATAQTVASNNIIAYGIFRFHEGMSICRFHELSHPYVKHTTKNISLQKQKAQTTNSDLIVWTFCFLYCTY